MAWPEAAAGTGAVSPVEPEYGAGIAGQSSAAVGVPRQPSAAQASELETGASSGAAVAWEQPGQPGRSHDPHEVTVQLDGLGRQVDEKSGRHAGKDAAVSASAQGSDGPVFVDESGRRRSLYRRLGIAVGTACAAYAVVIVGTLVSGNSDAPWLPVPMQKDDKPAGKVDTPPLPDEPAGRADTADGDVPGPGPGPASAPTGATSSPGGKSPTGSSGPAEKPAASTGAKPSAGPGTGGEPKPGPRPSTSAQAPEPSVSAPEPRKPDPSPPASPSPEPSDSGDPGPGTSPGSGSDPVAQGPASPVPVEPEPSTSESPQSPEERQSPQEPQNPQNPESPA
ncbi:hypothetical protein WBG99_22205 [Streptomyces sp. TG1A-60]|uniref:hypothetical protein n=1 Tax=Streptomyces sp. TG1A-60 TaxID=3129111 RepID=UPI0030D20384